MQQVTGGFLLQIVQVVAVGAMLFTLNAKLAFFTLIPAPLVIGGSLYFWKRVYPRYYRYWDSTNKQSAALSGMLSGIRVVKAFSQEEREYNRFTAKSDYLRRSRLTVDRTTAAFSAIMAVVFSLGGLIVWYVGGRDVLAGRMTIGQLMAFLAYLAMFYAPLSTLSQLTTWLTTFLTGCQKVFELLDTPTETREPTAPTELADPKGEVAFDNVSFGYEKHRPVLKNLSFTIRPGEKIGVVGRSGSGKTTLVNLISRFYDVDTGRVLIDGVDIRQLASSALRRHIGVVLQEPFLFRGTIGDNLVYGRPDASREEVIAAARAAQAHDFILRSPLGYDTWLGERGAGLSGGERQRVSHRPGAALRPQDPDPGRGHQQRRYRVGKGDPGSAPRGHPRPHHDRHRPPPQHPAQLGPHLRVRPRHPGRGGLAPPAHAARRPLCPPREDPVPDRA